MQFASPFDIACLYPEPEETLLEYWASWSPMAPVFGLEWRVARAFQMPDLVSSVRTTANIMEPVDLVPARAGDAVSKVIEAASAEDPKLPPAAAKTKAPAAISAEPAVKSTPTAKPKAKPATKAKATPAQKAKTTPDDLTKIKGIGPKLASVLVADGVKTFADIAKWTARDVKAWEARPEVISGRIKRDDWIGQAKSLTAAS